MSNQDRPQSGNRCKGNFAVTSELLELALQFPKDHHIRGILWDPTTNTAQLYVEGPTLPEVREGHRIPTVFPRMSAKAVDPEDMEDLRKITWDFNPGDFNPEQS